MLFVIEDFVERRYVDFFVVVIASAAVIHDGDIFVVVAVAFVISDVFVVIFYVFVLRVCVCSCCGFCFWRFCYYGSVCLFIYLFFRGVMYCLFLYVGLSLCGISGFFIIVVVVVLGGGPTVGQCSLGRELGLRVRQGSVTHPPPSPPSPNTDSFSSLPPSLFSSFLSPFFYSAISFSTPPPPSHILLSPIFLFLSLLPRSANPSPLFSPSSYPLPHPPVNKDIFFKKMAFL